MADQNVALVTGGGGAIGSAICRRLAGAGAIVLAAGRSTASTASIVEELGADARGIVMDVTDPASIAAAVSEAGRVDWLINNAGIADSAPLARTNDESFRRHMDVNFHGPRLVFEALLPGMLERGGGKVVQVASSAALRGYAFVAAYAASKHALLGYTRSAALELAKKNIALSAVCPHFVDTPMIAETLQRIAQGVNAPLDEARAILGRENPGGRLITPDEVALAVSELLDREDTGAVVELLGGDTREIDSGQPLGE